MGINNIQLSRLQLFALYPDVLVMEKNPDGQPSVTYRFLGNNLRKICFVVHYPDVVFLPEDQLEFLSKMLSACHCTIADVSVLNTAGTPVDIQELRKQLNPEMLFLCGIDPASVNLREQGEPFTITLYQGISVLFIPSLGVINQETADGKQLKTKLWNCLQKLFRL
jgi:hypothetical protein